MLDLGLGGVLGGGGGGIGILCSKLMMSLVFLGVDIAKDRSTIWCHLSVISGTTPYSG